MSFPNLEELKLDGPIPLTVRDVMTRKVIALQEDDTIENVQESMEVFAFRHLPVVRGDKLVGLITHRDMLRISSSVLSSDCKRRNRLLHQLPAKSIMCDEVVTVSEGDSLLTAAELIWEMRIGCLCVTDDDDRLIGILTEADFVHLAASLLFALNMKAAAQAAE